AAVEPIAGGLSEDQLLSLVASLERGSEHPLAAAIVAGAEDRKLRMSAHEQFESRTGKGVIGRVDGRTVAIGNRALLAEQGVPSEALTALSERAESLRSEGQTAMLVAIDGGAAGLIAVADPIKATTREAIDSLRADGLEIVMLTGDAR